MANIDDFVRRMTNCADVPRLLVVDAISLRAELATLREQHSNVLRENECQRQELASNKLVIDQLAHERNDTQAALEAAKARIAELETAVLRRGFLPSRGVREMGRTKGPRRARRGGV